MKKHTNESRENALKEAFLNESELKKNLYHFDTALTSSKKDFDNITTLYKKIIQKIMRKQKVCIYTCICLKVIR